MKIFLRDSQRLEFLLKLKLISSKKVSTLKSDKNLYLT